MESAISYKRISQKEKMKLKYTAVSFSSSNNPFWTGENMKQNKERKIIFKWNSLSWIYKCRAAIVTNCFSVAGWINHTVMSIIEKVNIFALLLYKCNIFLEENFLSMHSVMFFCFSTYISLNASIIFFPPLWSHVYV